MLPRGAIVPVRQASLSGPDRKAVPAEPGRQASPPAADQRAVAQRQRASELHWLTQINAARASAGLLPLIEDAEWSAASVLHSRYMVKNNSAGHDEDVDNAWYTPEGRAAGQNGNAYANYGDDRSDPPGIEAWLSTPFHLINVLDPRLAKTGFGWYRESPSDDKAAVDPDAYQIAATLDVARGLDPDGEPPDYPVFFPGHGQRMAYSRYFGSEHPDPSTSCPDRAFRGAPLMVRLHATPELSSVTLVKDGLRLDRCVFDETTDENADDDIRALGREVMATRHAVVIMPREPLTAGLYRVTLVSGGVTHTWAFAGPERDGAPTPVNAEAAVLPFAASLSVPPLPMLPVHDAVPASTSTSPPVRAVARSPRPDAGIGVVRQGNDHFLTIVAVQGVNNELRQLHFGQASQPLENAWIELNGYPAPIAGPGTITFPPGTTQVVFAVQRVADGGPTRAPFTITDHCGDWSTVVEGPTR